MKLYEDILKRRLIKKGLEKRVIKEFLSGKKVFNVDAFIIAEELRKLGAEIVYENEVGDLLEIPTYAMVLRLGDIVALYKASNTEHSIKTYGSTNDAVREAETFISEQ
ncbi:MAG: hypothetical protein N3E36_00960 [Sulfolobales archaeon]|nr:hypothetical protein [Sulfolobales archaeon]MCX8198588.1 hypothetical protein [Sulfolobales archaeon]MDW8169662.1 hypothetical protein [Desulfurococcaceae archaeon]